MFYLTTHSTHFIYGYMVKEHSDSERGNPLLPVLELLLFYMHHPRDRISPTTALFYTSRGALAGTTLSGLLLTYYPRQTAHG